MIHYRTIWDTGKNFGGMINREMEAIPHPDDWVVWRDGDTMFLHEQWGLQIESIIDVNLSYAIIGGMLTRCNVKDQLHGGAMSDNFDVKVHHIIAHELWNLHTTTVKPTSRPIAAACMMFQKKTWQANKFEENTMHFDAIFTHKVMANGGRVGVAQGLYLAHLYRPWVAEHPERHYGHLEQPKRQNKKHEYPST